MHAFCASKKKRQEKNVEMTEASKTMFPSEQQTKRWFSVEKSSIRSTVWEGNDGDSLK